jgi:hypothetical protein
MEGEFSHLVKQGAENAEVLPEEAILGEQEEDDALSLEVEQLSEEEQLDLLDQYMSILLEAGGKAKDPRDRADEESGFRRLIKRPFGRRS